MMSSLLKVRLQMEETLKKFLDKSQFPEDPEVLKEMIVTIARMSLESFSCFSKQLQISSENIEYLKSEVAVLKRFQFGQRSERLKKKQLRLLTTTAQNHQMLAPTLLRPLTRKRSPEKITQDATLYPPICLGKKSYMIYLLIKKRVGSVGLS